MSKINYKMDETTGEMVEDNSFETSSQMMMDSGSVYNFNETPSYSDDFEWPEEEKSAKPSKAHSKEHPLKRSFKGSSSSRVSLINPGTKSQKSLNEKKNKKARKLAREDNSDEDDYSAQDSVEVPNKAADDSNKDSKHRGHEIFTLYAHKADLKKGFYENVDLALWRHDERDILHKFGRDSEDLSQFHSTAFYYAQDKSRENDFIPIKVMCLNNNDMSTVIVINKDEVLKTCNERGRKWIYIKPLMAKHSRSKTHSASSKENQEASEAEMNS